MVARGDGDLSGRSEPGLLLPAVGLGFLKGVWGSLYEPKSNPDQDGGCSAHPIPLPPPLLPWKTWQSGRFHTSAASRVSLLCHVQSSEGPWVLGTRGEAAADHPLLLGSGKEEDGHGSSPSPAAGFSLCFRCGLSWPRAEPSTGQGLTGAKDIPGCHSTLCPCGGARESLGYPFLLGLQDLER